MQIKIFQLITPNIDGFGRYSASSLALFAKKYTYTYEILREQLITDMHINWTKIELLRRAFEDPGPDYFVLMDADLIINRNALPIEHLQGFGTHEILMPQDTPLFKPNRPNAGCIIVKNSDFGKKIIEDWINIARGRGSSESDIHPRNQRVFWKYLLPEYRSQLKLIDRSLFPKYHFFTPWFYKESTAYHFSQSNYDEREELMHRSYTKQFGQQELQVITSILDQNKKGRVVISLDPS